MPLKLYTKEFWPLDSLRGLDFKVKMHDGDNTHSSRLEKRKSVKIKCQKENERIRQKYMSQKTKTKQIFRICDLSLVGIFETDHCNIDDNGG